MANNNNYIAFEQIKMWTINYLKDNNPTFTTNTLDTKTQAQSIYHSPKYKYSPSINKSQSSVGEFDEGLEIRKRDINENAIGTRSKERIATLTSTHPNHEKGRLGQFNSLPELGVNSGLEFSFQENAIQHPVLNKPEQNNFTVKQQLLALVKPKLFQLKDCKNRLQQQCLNLKRQIISFQHFKTLFFDHFAQNFYSHLTAYSQTQKKEKNRLHQLVLHYIRDLEHSEAARIYFQEQNSKLQHTLQQKQQTIGKLRTQVVKLKTDIAQLQEENEEYFNQANSLQASIIKLTETASQGELLREELNRTKEQVKQLESKIGNRAQDALAFWRDIIQCRKEFEAKIKQGWSQFKGVCDQLLPLGEKIRQGFSQLDGPSRHRTQLAFLKSKAEQKIDALMAFQSSNYIQLCELQRDDARYKLYTLLNLMSQIKVSVFDQLKQSHGLLDYQKNCSGSMTAVIQHCSTSLQNQPSCSRTPSQSTYTSRKVHIKQMNQFLPNQSVVTMRTSDSQPYRTLSNSCSDSNIAISRISTRTIKRTETMSKISKIKERLNNLRMEVRQNLNKII